jgi:superfamily II DNA/RNA helicase
LKLGNIRQFILDECDKMLDQVGMFISNSNAIFTTTNVSIKTCAAMSKRFSAIHRPRSKL